MNAMDRFKRRLADALEYVCVLEERLERAEARIAELEEKIADREAETARPPEPSV